MSKAPAPKRPFAYEPRKRRAGDFWRLLVKAEDDGDPEPLCDYLAQLDKPLPVEECRDLADLLKRKLLPEPPARGRPRTDKTFAAACARHLVEFGKDGWCAASGKQRVPKAITERLIPPSIEWVERDMPSLRGKIRVEAVYDLAKDNADKATANVPKHEVAMHVEEFFPEAKPAMWKLGSSLK